MHSLKGLDAMQKTVWKSITVKKDALLKTVRASGRPERQRSIKFAAKIFARAGARTARYGPGGWRRLLKAFFIGARLKTLPAVWAPVAMACGLAFQREGAVRWSVLALMLVSGTFIQLAVNFFNDALDFQHGYDKSDRKGPDRITQQGLADFKTVFGFGVFSSISALLFGLPLALYGGWPIAVLGLLSLASAYMYSGTSFALSRNGAVSDLFVVLFFGFGAVMGAYFLLTDVWEESLILLSLQCGLQAMSLLVINHLRDEKEDLRYGKKNTVTLYGRETGLLQLIIAQALVYLLCFYWMGFAGTEKGAVLAFCSLPFAVVLIYRICVTAPGKIYNRFLFLMSLLYSLFAALWVYGLTL